MHVRTIIFVCARTRMPRSGGWGGGCIFRWVVLRVVDGGVRGMVYYGILRASYYSIVVTAAVAGARAKRFGVTKRRSSVVRWRPRRRSGVPVPPSPPCVRGFPRVVRYRLDACHYNIIRIQCRGKEAGAEGARKKGGPGAREWDGHGRYNMCGGVSRLLRSPLPE